MKTTAILLSTMFSVVLSAAALQAAKPLTLENVTSPGANKVEEPIAEKFSHAGAIRFMESAALNWTKTRKCFTCHTNYAYLMAVPAVSSQTKAHQQIRTALEEMVEKRWEEKGPRWDAEVVMSATVLAMNDAATTGKLHATTRKALDKVWTLQREDGGFSWLKCNWPPMESDDHYGATIAAVGIGAAPDGYAKTPQAQKGLEGIRKYLRNNPPPALHHRAMVLWASTYVEGIASEKEQQQTIKLLRANQKADGGWGLASLGDWSRADKKEQDTKSSDGYGTGFVIYVLRRAGVPADDPQIQKGVAWLKKNQRLSGRWYTRSLNKDSKHYITHAGTAFSLIALDACKKP